jgi:FtsP/CotA-like multicopper oxidase with cupredoxin domain
MLYSVYKFTMMMPTWSRAALFAAALSVLPVTVVAESLQPQGWRAGAALKEAVDVNPDPRIVEINLTARIAPVEIAPGQRVDAWTYDGGLPGPLIRAQVGDRLIVHFSNALPKPTTVHWHGVRVPIEMDGVPGVSQPDVLTGETFTYDFTVSDAGLYWYHPHVMSAAQVGFGLYGPLLVEDPAERSTVRVDDELVLVLSDIGLEADGTLADPDSGDSAGMAFGREGDHVLVNGRKNPRIVVRSGAPQRWRIVNAAKSRYFEIDMDGSPFHVIGRDGGLQEFPVKHDRLVIAPGERVDAIVAPKGTPGNDLTVLALLYNRGYGSIEAREPYDELLTIGFADLPSYTEPIPEQPRREIAPLDVSRATKATINLTIAQLQDGSFEYGIDGTAFAAKTHLKVTPGETQVWTLVNTTPWSHPFHLHGFFFQVLEENGAPRHPIAWKDTVDVPFKRTVRVAVRFDDDRAGAWMYHCHVLDHADGGLMGYVRVGDAPEPPSGHHSHHGATGSPTSVP